jgi:hypothetical protein
MSRLALTDLSATPSLIYPLEELQDRISLEVPASYIKEESIRESSDQQQARLQIIWYTTEDNDPEGQQLNVAKKITPIVEDVMANKPVNYDIMSESRSRNTYMTMVTLTWADDKVARTAAEVTTANEVPLTFYANENVYSFLLDGTTVSLLKNGGVLADGFDSLAQAFGAATAPLVDEIATISNVPGEDVLIDSLFGAAEYVVDSDALSDKAKESFVDFFELATNKDFDAVIREEDEDG